MSPCHPPVPSRSVSPAVRRPSLSSYRTLGRTDPHRSCLMCSTDRFQNRHKTQDVQQLCWPELENKQWQMWPHPSQTTEAWFFLQLLVSSKRKWGERYVKKHFTVPYTVFCLCLFLCESPLNSDLWPLTVLDASGDVNVVEQTCLVSDLDPFTSYTCSIQPKYKEVDEEPKLELKLKTEPGSEWHILVLPTSDDKLCQIFRMTANTLAQT